MSDEGPILEPRDQVRILVLETLQPMKDAFGALAENRDVDAAALLDEADARLARARRYAAALLNS